MYAHRDFIESLNCTLDMLGWSTERLAEQLDNKYKTEFLRRVREGKPFGEVEQDVIRALVAGLAQKLQDSTIEVGLPAAAGTAASQAYFRVVDYFALRLRDAVSLARAACTRVATAEAFRTQTVDVTDIDIWDSLLESIARDISQGKLFRVEHSHLGRSEELPSLVHTYRPSQHTTSPSGRADYYSRSPDECSNCHSSTAEFKSAKCDHCGYPWAIPNW